MDVPVPFHLLQIKGAHFTFHTVWVLICTWVADVLEGGEVVEDLVPLHVRPHLGKHQLVVMHARKGEDAQISDEHKRTVVLTTVTQAGFKQSTKSRLLNTRHVFVFWFSSVSLLVEQGWQGSKKENVFLGETANCVCPREQRLPLSEKKGKTICTRFSKIFSASWTNMNVVKGRSPNNMI